MLTPEQVPCRRVIAIKDVWDSDSASVYEAAQLQSADFVLTGSCVNIYTGGHYLGRRQRMLAGMPLQRCFNGPNAFIDFDEAITLKLQELCIAPQNSQKNVPKS